MQRGTTLKSKELTPQLLREMLAMSKDKTFIKTENIDKNDQNKMKGIIL